MPRLLSVAVAIALFVAVLPALAAPVPRIVADKPIALAGEHGGFDFMQVDLPKRRLLVAHTDNNTFDVFSLDTGARLACVPAIGAQGVTTDAADGKYFVSNGDGHSVTVVDRDSFRTLATIPLSGPGDDALYDPANGTLYVAHDDGTQLWTIDAKTNRLTGALAIPGVPEVMALDAPAHRLYLNIKDKNEVAVLDTASGRTLHNWWTGTAALPHGLQLDSARGRLYIAGGNGHFVTLDARTGRVLQTLPIAPHVDQVAFDRARGLIYCAGGQGELSVLRVSATGVAPVATLPTPRGTHTLAVDPATGALWVCYATSTAAYIQRFHR